MKSVFARKLSKLRREAGYSQRQAAAGLSISQALLSHYENGVREPKLEFVVKACDYYGVSADHILGRPENTKQAVLPTPQGCEGASRLIAAANAVFEHLDGQPDKELYSSAVDYLVIPIEYVDAFLRDPGAEYDPLRDAELKMAEAKFISKVRGKASSGHAPAGDAPAGDAPAGDVVKP